MTGKKLNDNTPWQKLTPGGIIQASGNSCEFRTGDWRTLRPELDEERCRQCLLCAPVCPDLSIPVADGKREGFDLNFCKGCGICANVCPFQAIRMVPEDQGTRG